MGYSHTLHHLLGTLAAFLARHSHIQERQLDVLHHIQLINEVEALEHKTYHASSYQGALTLLQRAHILAVEQIAAACGIIQQTYYIKQGRLAATRRSHNGNKLAFLHLQADIAECPSLYFFCLKYFLYII